MSTKTKWSSTRQIFSGVAVSSSAVSKTEKSLTMSSDQNQMVKHAMGEQAQLGALYDARTGTLYCGLSLWDLKDLNNNQKFEEIPDTKFTFSSSLKETRKNSDLDLEASVGLDVGLVKVKGAAKYLTKTTVNSKEARVDVTCVKVNRGRYIPMETMMKATYLKSTLQNSNCTHFVSRVVEGGVGNIKFVRKCSSSEEASKVSGLLAGQLKKYINAEGKGEKNDEDFEYQEEYQIEVSGAIDIPISTFEDALKYGPKLPQMLKPFCNTIEMTLLSIKFLDSRHQAIVRSLDEKLLQNISNFLDRANETASCIHELQECEHLALFPDLKVQNANFAQSYDDCLSEFRKVMRDYIPQMKSEASCEAEIMNTALRKIETQTKLGEFFIQKKEEEKAKLEDTMKTFFDSEFDNFLIDSNESSSLLKKSLEIKIALNFAGEGFADEHHFLEAQLKSDSVVISEPNKSPDWFEENGNVALLRQSYDQICELKECNAKTKMDNIRYGFGSFREAFSTRDSKERVLTSIGDIIAVLGGKEYVITGHMPCPPSNIALRVSRQTITVSWSFSPDPVLPINFFHIRWRPKASDKRAVDSTWQNKELQMSFFRFSITTYEGSCLKPETCYEIQLASQCEIGLSRFAKFEESTEKLPSVAQNLIDFFSRNKHTLGPDRIKCRSASDQSNPWENKRNEKKPWEVVGDTLHIGYTTVSGSRSESPGYENQLEYLIVDVVPEFEPEIPFTEPGNEKAKVFMLVGQRQSGKSSQINAFLSYMIDADPTKDRKKICLVDQRSKIDQSKQSTEFITVYRFRPLTRKFKGNTFYLVDTPGFQRSDTHAKFMKNSISNLFHSLQKVNAIVLVCQAKGFDDVAMRKLTDTLFYFITEPVRDKCLMSIMPFKSKSDCQDLQNQLRKLKWPLRQECTLEVDITNETFWQGTPDTQPKILKMLLSTEDVSTDKQLQKFCNRNELVQNASEVESQMFTFVGESLNKLFTLQAISEAFENPPEKPIQIRKNLIKFNHKGRDNNTTICIDCNQTCHEECGIPDHEDKHRCSAMRNEKCTVCFRKCHWTRHKNSRFLIETKTQTEIYSKEEFFRQCEDKTKTFEGATVKTLDRFEDTYREVLRRIDLLVAISEKVENKPIRGDCSTFKEFFDRLLKTTKAQGASEEHLEFLRAVQVSFLEENTFIRATEIAAMRAISTTILQDIRKVLQKRSQMSIQNRAQEKAEVVELLQNIKEVVTFHAQMHSDSSECGEFRRIRAMLQSSDTNFSNEKTLIDLLKDILESGNVNWSEISRSQNW